MDPQKRPAGKTYSELMNEWSAQKNFVKGNRSRLLHPPWDASPFVKFLGYLGRILILIILPAAVFVFMLRGFGRSKEWNDEISRGVATTLGASKAEATGSVWQLDGMFSLVDLQVTGAPDSFYESMRIRNLGTRIPIPAVFRRIWNLPRVSMQELDITLRAGGIGKMPRYEPAPGEEIQLPSLDAAPDSKSLFEPPGPKTGWVQAPPSRELTAGFGISPDFQAMKFQSLQIARLNAKWGNAPSTSGAVTGLQTDIIQTTAGWSITGNGGVFRQNWLEGLKLTQLAVDLQPDKAVIREVLFAPATGGKAKLAGTIQLGEFPEVDADMSLEGIKVQDLLQSPAANLFTADANGSLHWSGSLNRSSGLAMEGKLDLLSGRVLAFPLLKILDQLTGEEQFRLLTIRSGTVEFRTSGSEEHGGSVVEVKSMNIDCGGLARIRGSLRYELSRATLAPTSSNVSSGPVVSGQIELGISSMAAGHLRPAVANKFFPPGEGGWHWISIPVQSIPGSSFSQPLATAVLEAHTAAGE